MAIPPFAVSAGRALALSVVVVAVAACGGDSTTPTAPAGDIGQVEQTSFNLLNASRVSAGLPAFQRAGDAALVARELCAGMRDHGFFGHRDQHGRDLEQRLSDAGVVYTRAAENIGRVTGAPDPALWIHEELVGSPEHLTNIVDPEFSLVGVGVASSGDTYWITQIFIQP